MKRVLVLFGMQIRYLEKSRVQCSSSVYDVLKGGDWPVLLLFVCLKLLCILN